MIQIRKSNERGYADHGWLKSHHTFSFANYFNPAEMGFGPLRVINEDRVAPGMGFGTHGHRDMEIISYVLAGELAHKDSMGNGSVLRPGDVQKMSAGTGVQHSEFNHSDTEGLHFLQIWIEPNVKGIVPNYDEKHFTAEDKRGQLRLIASPDGRDGSIKLYQNAELYAMLLDGETPIIHELKAGRIGYVHVIRGELQVNGVALQSGDAAKITAETRINFNDARRAEALLFDLS